MVRPGRVPGDATMAKTPPPEPDDPGRPPGEGPGFSLLHYLLLERIGAGGMSEVWRASDRRLGREVALKLLPLDVIRDPERLAMFKSEARIVASLNHPNIVTLFSFEESEGLPFITMELVRGRTLRELIPAGGFPLPDFYALATPIARAVAAAHERGIVHGDLKPGNVMVTYEGLVKILDFGLARFRQSPAPPASGEPSTATLDVDARISGTMVYMAPEQLQGKPPGEAADVFALAVMFYEMLSGRRPFHGDSTPDLMAAILRDEPPSLAGIRPELPRHLLRILGRCLDKDPGRRPSGAQDVVRELEALQRDAAAGAAPDETSIAVLPPADLSPEGDQGYFCDGIAEEIIDSLGHVRGLRVAPRTSSFKFKGAAMDARELGDRLGVGALLEGSVRKAGQKLRVTARLTCVKDGSLMWSGRYDRELRDVFDIQHDIAMAIVEALEVTLTPRERRALVQAATGNPDAYDYYLRGRSFFNQFRRRGIEFAVQMFTRAIEHDPAYARAYAGIADCRSYLYLNLEHEEAHRRVADEASRKALELDPDLAEAHAARGLALSLFDRFEEACAQFETAMRLAPRSFEAAYFYARTCFQAGRPDEAIRLYERASEVRPEDYQAPLLLAQIYEDEKHPERAEEARRRGVRRAEERLDIAPDDVRALYMGANGLVALGEREKGLSWAERARKIEPDEPMLLYNLACIYALAADPDRAMECLEKAVELGFYHKPWLEHDSNLDSLRELARFKAVVAKLG